MSWKDSLGRDCEGTKRRSLDFIQKRKPKEFILVFRLEEMSLNFIFKTVLWNYTEDKSGIEPHKIPKKEPQDPRIQDNQQYQWKYAGENS